MNMLKNEIYENNIKSICIPINQNMSAQIENDLIQDLKILINPENYENGRLSRKILELSKNRKYSKAFIIEIANKHHVELNKNDTKTKLLLGLFSTLF